jgi:uncharacterized paraquat-inducible protein A
VTLAIGAAKQAGDQFKASEIISTHRHHLQHPGVGLKELASFSAHSLAWLMNGAPTRTRAERLEILNTCMSCDFYQPESETEGHCRQCKCPISEDAPKLAMKTERCPENKW